MTTRLGMDDARTLLRSHFGYTEFRPGQRQAIDSVLGGRDTLVVLPTGGGKSLCYQIPALMLPCLTVIISPLISLMKDQVDALTARGLAATFINSTLTSSEIADRMARVQRRECKLLYVAPERFDVGSMAGRLAQSGVSLLAVDEAHCISEWGHDFRPSYRRIGQIRERLGSPPVIALTATATPDVRADIVKQLGLVRPQTIVTGFDRRNLRYHVVPTTIDDDKDRALTQILGATDGLAIVYANTRKAVQRITHVLENARVRVASYHAGLGDDRRHEVQDAFMTERVRVIVATNAFGMGIDKKNVRLVVHSAMPGTLEAYYQEAGRAGRDGLPADCYLLHAFPDRFTHEFFIKSAYPDRTVVERVYSHVQQLAAVDGDIQADAETIASGMRGRITTREVESALRILAHGGALRSSGEISNRVFVRLLATPDRIRRELQSTASLELALLRALWRAGGDALACGTIINIDSFPSSFGGSHAILGLLAGLQARQFVEWRRIESGRRVSDRAKPISGFAIDWKLTERRRRADLEKLDTMQRYAYSKHCRRGFILRYFGDPAASRKCDGCDNCLGRHLVIRSSAAGHFHSARPTARAPKQAALSHPGRIPASSKADPVLSGHDEALLSSLRALRSAIAREEKVPAYIVFADRTLIEMAARRPTTLLALQTVRGVGPAKRDRYGERFLHLLRQGPNTKGAR